MVLAHKKLKFIIVLFFYIIIYISLWLYMCADILSTYHRNEP